MKYTGSIKKKLTRIILLVTFLTSIIGYGSFISWYMDDQYKRSLDLSRTVGYVLSQDIAKLVLLNEVSVAADMTSLLKSFPSLDTMVLYKLDGTSIFQYNKEDKSFNVKVFSKDMINKTFIKDGKIKLYINASYQGTHLGYVELNLQVNTILDIVNENIFTLLFILVFMFLLSYLLATFYAKMFTNPILILVSYLEKIKGLDSINNSVETDENNEYGKLYAEINIMLERIKNSQEALKLAAVAFETQSGMTITDANQKILKINKAFTKITGYTEEDSLGNTPAMLKSGIHDEKFYNEMNEALTKYNYWSGEITNRHKNGSIVNEYLSIQIVVDTNGKTLYYVASFSDITLQKEIEEKLNEKESMLIQQSKMAAMGEMLENIAHQWRQPLSVISTVATGIITQKEFDIPLDKNEEIQNLNQINDSVQYLSQTIDDFRDFFKPNKEKNKFSVEEKYHKTLQLVNSKFKNLNIEVIENIHDVMINGLDNELMQVMMNILNNARDVLETKDQKRMIFVNIYTEDNNVIIEIKDNAGGIPDEIIKKVFDPYFTTKHKKQGTGIGLYMSSEMVNKHMSGVLKVENKTYKHENIEYIGASFLIKIPINMD